MDEALVRTINGRGGVIIDERTEPEQVSNARMGEVAAELKAKHPGAEVIYGSRPSHRMGDRGETTWYVWRAQ